MSLTYQQFALPTINKPGIDLLPLELTPGNTLSPGEAPAGKFVVAPYLPRLRFNQEKLTYVVISSGKIVAFDKGGFVVPAGYRLEAAAYATALATSVAAADAQALITYTALDVQRGTLNYKGVLVTAGEPVVKSWFTGTTQDNTVAYHTGVAFSDVFEHAGGNNENPTLLKYTNFNIQPTIAILGDYHMQYPLVKDVATVRTSALAGIAAFVGLPTTFGFGTFVTYDRESNFVPANPAGDLHGFGSTNAAAIVGQITSYRINKDPSTGTVVAVDNMLDKIVAPNAATASLRNQMPNVLNQGQSTFVTLSNGYGVVEFGLQAR